MLGEGYGGRNNTQTRDAQGQWNTSSRIYMATPPRGRGWGRPEALLMSPPSKKRKKNQRKASDIRKLEKNFQYPATATVKLHVDHTCMLTGWFYLDKVPVHV